MNPVLDPVNKVRKREKIEEKKKEVEIMKTKINAFVNDATKIHIALSAKLNHDQRRQLHNYVLSINLWPNYRDIGRFISMQAKFISRFVYNRLGSANNFFSFSMLSDGNRVLVVAKKQSAKKPYLALTEASVDILQMEFTLNHAEPKNKYDYEFDFSAPILTIPPRVDVIPFRKTLQIFEYRSEILSMVNNNQVIVISGQTGMNYFNINSIFSFNSLQ